MKKIIIEGCLATNFGVNNYSNGMEAIVFDAMTTTVDRVKNIPGIFLHPLCEPNQLEIFTLRGTEEQFNGFYEDCIQHYATKEAYAKYDFMDAEQYPKFEELKNKLISEFKPWYA